MYHINTYIFNNAPTYILALYLKLYRPIACLYYRTTK